MRKQHEKLMADLDRLIGSKNFKSEKEFREFLDTISGKVIPSFPEEALNNEELAQDLVFEAYEQKPAKAKATIEKALQLNRDCIEAYEFLGSLENTPEIACVFYEKGISIGRRIFGDEFLKENKGHFWGIHKTRPFMRCLQQYAECLYLMDKENESIAVLEDLIELNPNDNQGVRDQLMLYLVQQNEVKKYLKYFKLFGDESTAFSLFNRALFLFKTEGESQKAKMQLLKAIKQNKFVVSRLLSNRPVLEISDSYSLGSEDEADYYASYAFYAWADTKGAREWLKKHTVK